MLTSILLLFTAAAVQAQKVPAPTSLDVVREMRVKPLVTGGESFEGRVEIQRATLEPTTIKVKLSSTHPSLVAIPAEVELGGVSVQTFRVSTQPVRVDTAVTFTAALGKSSVTSQMVLLAPQLASLTCASPTVLHPATELPCMISLTGETLDDVALQPVASAPLVEFIPPTVRIQRSKGGFRVLNKSPQEANITLSVSWQGTTRSVPLTITPRALKSLTVHSGGTAGAWLERDLTVRLTAPAGGNGLGVNLSARLPQIEFLAGPVSSFITIPDKIHIPANSDTGTVKFMHTFYFFEFAATIVAETDFISAGDRKEAPVTIYGSALTLERSGTGDLVGTLAGRDVIIQKRFYPPVMAGTTGRVEYGGDSEITGPSSITLEGPPANST